MVWSSTCVAPWKVMSSSLCIAPCFLKSISAGGCTAKTLCWPAVITAKQIFVKKYRTMIIIVSKSRFGSISISSALSFCSLTLKDKISLCTEPQVMFHNSDLTTWRDWDKVFFTQHTSVLLCDLAFGSMLQWDLTSLHTSNLNALVTSFFFGTQQINWKSLRQHITCMFSARCTLQWSHWYFKNRPSSSVSLQVWGRVGYFKRSFLFDQNYQMYGK